VDWRRGELPFLLLLFVVVATFGILVLLLLCFEFFFSFSFPSSLFPLREIIASVARADSCDWTPSIASKKSYPLPPFFERDSFFPPFSRV